MLQASKQLTVGKDRFAVGGSLAEGKSQNDVLVSRDQEDSCEIRQTDDSS